MRVVHFPQVKPFFSTLKIKMLFDFIPKMDTTPQFQKLANPNPSFDQLVNHNSDHSARHLPNDLQYFHNISNYLMSDEDLEDRLLSKNKDVVEDVNSGYDEPLASAPLEDHNMCKRMGKKGKHEFRLAFRTKSDLEFMDDGFKWRKYGKKKVKSSPNPRNYFKCTSGGCSVKKRVEREREDSRYVITTYEGVHNHDAPTRVIYCRPATINF